jgi:acyl carrier protein
MELEFFIEKIAEQFEETEKEAFTANTRFKELDEWSSLVALSVIAMVDDEYGVAVKGNDIRNVTSINDLYEIVKFKL